MNKIIPCALLISIAVGLNGCVVAAVGGGAAVGGYAVAKDKGTVGQYTSDSIITSKIKSKYLADIHLKSYNISVTTQSGHVTLTGSVPTAQMRASAIEDARSTAGVKSVNVTNFTVRP
jgi:hyperosmotically inducible periplasmic protein